MKKFAFISRHVPTQEQHALAAEQDIEIIHVGDADAFTVDSGWVEDQSIGLFDGVVVVHPAASMRLCNNYIVGIFKNENRAPDGQPLQFLATELHLFDLRS